MIVSIPDPCCLIYFNYFKKKDVKCVCYMLLWFWTKSVDCIIMIIVSPPHITLLLFIDSHETSIGIIVKLIHSY